MRKLHILILILLFILIFVSATFDVNDTDTIYYVASGRYVSERGIFPSDCPFLYTGQNCQPYSEWLFHFSLYKMYQFFSWAGIVIIQILINVSVFVLMYLHARRHRYSFFSTSLLFVFAAYIAMERFMLRADTISVLFALLLFTLLDIYYFFRKDQASIFHWSLIGIPIVELLWANCHGSFPLGYLIMSAFIGEGIIDSLKFYLRSQHHDSKIIKKTLTLIGVAFISLVCSTVNPYGLTALLWPLTFYFDPQHVSHHSQNNALPIAEFRNPWLESEFDTVSIIIYRYMSFLFLGITLLSIKKWKFYSLSLFLLFYYLSLGGLRNLMFFAGFSFLVVPGYLDESVRVLSKFASKKISFSLFKKNAHIFGVIYYCLFIFLLFFLIRTFLTDEFYIADKRSRRFGFGISDLSFPKTAADFILANNLRGNIYNDYITGTGISMLLYPQYKGFIHGHIQDPSFYKEYSKIMIGQTDLNEVIKKYNINFFFFTHAYPDTPLMIDKLYKSKDWKIVYFDELSVIFLANKPENQEIIKKYEVDFITGKNYSPNTLKFTKAGSTQSGGYTALGNFFSFIGLYDYAIREYYNAVKVEPKNFSALNNIGVIYYNRKDFSKAIEMYKKSVKQQPRNALTHFNLGEVYLQMNKYDDAEREYQESININKNEVTPYQRLARIAQIRGDIHQMNEYNKKGQEVYNRTKVTL